LASAKTPARSISVPTRRDKKWATLPAAKRPSQIGKIISWRQQSRREILKLDDAITGQSFLLYSVGPNGVDNGGKSLGTGVGNDDIAVRGGPAVLK